MDLDQYLLQHYGSMTNVELVRDIEKDLGIETTTDAIRNRWYILNQGGKMSKRTPKQQVARDVESSRAKKTAKSLKDKYDRALERIEALEESLGAFETIKSISTFTIEPKQGVGVGEATIVVLASDWHIEENVRPEEVNGKNEYTIAIARRRVEEFFQGVLKLSKILGRDVKVDTMILALLGDFISGDIHDELLETTELEPADAVIEAKNMIASGIEFLLKHTKYTFVIPCHSGNHARTTEKSRNATEAGHSLEYIMYHFLAKHFEGNPRVKFIIPRSYHSYVKVYDMKLRFSHGHAIRYGGGVGGPTISINKAIANWNTMEWADIDCFGHLHQRLDGENFVMNGSVIGYNAYAIRIKAKYQKPSQTMFLIDKKRGKTCVWPVVFTV